MQREAAKCWVSCFQTPAFPGTLWTCLGSRSSQLLDQSVTIAVEFWNSSPFFANLYWNTNIVGLGIYFLQLIICWKWYFLSPQFNGKVFFQGGKYIDIHSRFIIQQTVQFRVSASPLIGTIDRETLLSYHHLLCTASLQRAPDPTEFGSRVTTENMRQCLKRELESNQFVIHLFKWEYEWLFFPESLMVTYRYI